MVTARAGRKPAEPVAVETAEISRAERYHGARLVASVAKDAEDCAMLLSMLGLDPADGLERD